MCYKPDIKIIVATHKSYWMPSDPMYLPLQVGACGSTKDLGLQKDDTGVNISSKNSNYCELTGLYWAWKNIKADYIGLAHYRRHFSYRGAHGGKKDRILDTDKARELVQKADIILPTPRNYVIETNYSQYAHAHHAIDLDMTREIIGEKYPEYINAYDISMKSTRGHKFNMFIMRYDRFCEYCSWLFDILFELEKHLDISSYSTNDARVFGFVSEWLLDIWIMTNHYYYLDTPYVFMDKQNWLIKGSRFVGRKIRAIGSDFSRELRGQLDR